MDTLSGLYGRRTIHVPIMAVGELAIGAGWRGRYGVPTIKAPQFGVVYPRHGDFFFFLKKNLVFHLLAIFTILTDNEQLSIL